MEGEQASVRDINPYENRSPGCMRLLQHTIVCGGLFLCTIGVMALEKNRCFKMQLH